METCAANLPVPMLDVNRQNAPLQAEIAVAIAAVAESGAFVHGPACQKFEQAMATYCGAKHAIGCASGSDALLLALMVLGVKQGDEVVIPSFTFFATAGAVWRLGATPVFADIEPETFNLDPADVKRKITPATKAIIPVHLFGQVADMTALAEVAEQAGDIPIVEDAAQAIGATHNGQRAGSTGTLGCFSFYPTKNLGAFGDGGLITTNDEKLASELRILRDHGQHPRYHHKLVGVNSRLDAIQAAVLQVKLSQLDTWTAGRQKNACRYGEKISHLRLGGTITSPEVSQGNQSVWNQYTVRVADGKRDALQTHFSQQKIGSAIYYPVPLHLQECFAELGYQPGSLPETERAAEEVLSLPIFAELTESEQDRVVDSLAEFCNAQNTVDQKSSAA